MHLPEQLTPHKPQTPTIMRTTLTLLFLALVAGLQAQVITKLHEGTSHFSYNPDDLVAIVQNAADGDTIVLPGGPLNLNGSLLVDKRLTVVGAGALNMGTPVTGTTTIIGTNVGGFQEKVLIQSTGKGSSFHGIRFDAPVEFVGFGNNDPTFSASFTRCMFLSTFSLGGWASPVTPPAASNVHVKQCIFLWSISSSGSTAPQGFLAENCLIQDGVSFGGSIANAQVTQCVLLNMTPDTPNAGVVFTNNIITRNSSSHTLNDASTYANNLFVLLGGGSGLIWSGATNGGGNVTSTMTLGNIFMNVGSNTTFNEVYNYELSGSSPGLGIGLGGFDAGIHDGPSPWKEDAIPFNPHWISLVPALGGTNGGVINVNLSGAAQQD